MRWKGQQQQTCGNELKQALLHRHRGGMAGRWLIFSGFQLPVQAGKLEGKQTGDHQYRIGHQREAYVQQ